MYNNKRLRDYSYDDLQELRRLVDDEIIRRKELKKTLKIEAFKKAWKDLHDNDIMISYNIGALPEDACCAPLNNWDNFSFD